MNKIEIAMDMEKCKNIEPITETLKNIETVKGNVEKHLPPRTPKGLDVRIENRIGCKRTCASKADHIWI